MHALKVFSEQVRNHFQPLLNGTRSENQINVVSMSFVHNVFALYHNAHELITCLR